MAAYDTVHEIATEQHGVLKATQAIQRGVKPKTLVAMAARGRLERISYGLYRDLRVPQTRWTLYMEAALWPYGTTVGLLMGETVLALLDLSDVNLAVIHVAVPAAYRARRRPPPPGVVMHNAAVPAQQRTAIEGIPATTVERAIRDCAKAHLGPALLGQAIAGAARGGWLTMEEERDLTRSLTASGKL